MAFVKEIFEKYKIISIVGMAKNSGKTTSLNYLIDKAMENDLRLGLVSTGRDGESLDIVNYGEKPKIFVQAGTIIATATDLIKQCETSIEILNITDFRSPMGNILIGRAIDSGYVQIAGPQPVKELKEVTSLISSYQVDLILIDGAIDRKASAAPLVSQGCILATGAVLSRDIKRLVEETLYTAKLLSLKEVDPSYRKPIKNLIENNKIGLVNEDLQVESLNIRTAINNGRLIGERIKGDTRYIVIPGSLVDTTIEDLIQAPAYKKNSKVEIAVQDGTKIFSRPRGWLKYIKLGLRVKALYPINLIGITLNPISPQGYSFESQELIEKLGEKIKDIPIIDVRGG